MVGFLGDCLGDCFGSYGESSITMTSGCVCSIGDFRGELLAGDFLGDLVAIALGGALPSLYLSDISFTLKASAPNAYEMSMPDGRRK